MNYICAIARENSLVVNLPATRAKTTMTIFILCVWFHYLLDVIWSSAVSFPFYTNHQEEQTIEYLVIIIWSDKYYIIFYFQYEDWGFPVCHILDGHFFTTVFLIRVTCFYVQYNYEYHERLLYSSLIKWMFSTRMYIWIIFFFCCFRKKIIKREVISYFWWCVLFVSSLHNNSEVLIHNNTDAENHNN